MHLGNRFILFLKRQWLICISILRWKFFIGKFGKRVILRKPRIVNNPRVVSIGERTTIEKDAILADLAIGMGQSPKIIIGNNSTFLFQFQCNAAVSVRMGNNILCASNVFITDSDHIVEPDGIPVTRNLTFTSKPVSIGDNCWIGQNAVILKGVKIGNYSIVGANSVVTKNVPAYSVVAGNPAVIIRSLRNIEKKDRV